jgi:hypothetical protein
VSYMRSSHAPLGVTRDQQKILLESVTEDELRELPAEERLRLVLRRQEAKAAESGARWGALATFVSIAVPVTAFFGISWATKNRR